MRKKGYRDAIYLDLCCSVNRPAIHYSSDRECTPCLLRQTGGGCGNEVEQLFPEYRSKAE